MNCVNLLCDTLFDIFNVKLKTRQISTEFQISDSVCQMAWSPGNLYVSFVSFCNYLAMYFKEILFGM